MLLGQIDYCYFFNGLALVLVAAVSFTNAKTENPKLPWAWLGLFGITLGSKEWLDLIASGLGDSFWFLGGRVAILTVSFLLLAEFGRAGTLKLSGRGPSRWILAPLALVAVGGGLVAGWVGVDAAARYALGLVGGAWTAVMLWRAAAGMNSRARRWLRAGSVAVGCYALAALVGLFQPPGFPSPVMPQLGLWHTLVYPAQFLRGIIAACAAIAFGAYGRRTIHNPGRASRTPSFHGANGLWMFPAVLSLCALGWIVTQISGQQGDVNARRELILRALTTVVAINPESVANLSGSSADVGSAELEALQRRLQTIRAVNSDCRFVYLMGLRDGQIVFLADSEAIDSKDYSPPGQVYEEASPELLALFANGKAFVEGPVSDPWGTWISAHAPIWDKNFQQVIAVVGLDVSAQPWQQAVAIHRLVAIAFILSACILTIGFFVWMQLNSQTEETLQRCEERYHDILEDQTELISRFRRDGTLTYVNQAYCRYFGVRREDLIGRSFLPLLPAEDRAARNKHLGSLSRVNPAGSIEHCIIRADGEICWQRWTDHAIFDEDGNIVEIQAVGHDISEQKEVQRLLRQERERLAAVLDGSPVASLMIDQNRAVLLWNRAAEVMCHVPRQQVLGEPLDSSPFYNGKRVPILAELLLQMSEKEILKHYGKNETLQYDPRLGVLESKGYIIVKGEKRILKIIAARVKDPAGKLIGVIQCAQDITREEGLQKQLLHAQKMESIGTLAGGMAHEFNNILGSIRGYAQLIHMKLGSGHPLSGYLNEIDLSCQRAANLTYRMLTFSRADEGKRIPIKVNDLLVGIERLLRHTLPPQVEVQMDLRRGLPSILADPNQLEQVIINLAVNAKDAMPRGGTLRLCSTLTVVAKKPPDPHDAASFLKPGRYLEIQVEDSGEGIPPEIVNRIFDPFFTTKEPGKGTGLGLYIAYSIMEAHKGHIRVHSAGGQGSCFHLYFPVLEEEVECDLAGASGANFEHLSGHGESILVVEDEEPLRRLMLEILKSHGYQVVSAAHGREAITICQQAQLEKQRFDLVVMDLAMPFMGGQECLDQLLRLYPDLRVLVVSGLIENAPGDEALRKAQGYLRKPFQLVTLLENVQQALRA
jgi:two-component system, cell cycle sensor histidine kinase and response regulator CckA